MLTNITGVILAGGKSSRMGADKALLDLNGKPFIQHIAETLKKVFKTVVIISDHGERYRFLDLPTYPDIFKNCGPLGAMHSALTHSKTETTFIVSCDLPFLSSNLVRHIINSRNIDNVTICSVRNRLQPLCGLYRKSCLPLLEQHLKSGQYKVRLFLRDVKTTILSVGYLSELEPSYLLRNVNTPEEYLKCAKEFTLRSHRSAWYA